MQPMLRNGMNQLQERMAEAFERLSGGSTWPTLAQSYPAMNVWEDDNNLYAEAELPGVSLELLNIHVTAGNLLTIQGERQACDGKGVWHRQERGLGKFNRELQLPFQVNTDEVQARLEQGVLTLTLPKSQNAKPHRITVKGE